MKRYGQKQKGGIKWILLLVIGLILASYFFDFSVQDAVEDERTQQNYHYLKEKAGNFYQEHLAETIDPLRNQISIAGIFGNFITSLKDSDLKNLGTLPSGDDIAAPQIEMPGNEDDDGTEPHTETE